MARLARIVIPGLPHLVTQRGKDRRRVFFGEDDYALYRKLLAASCHAEGVEIWAYVLMPTHVHLILVPSDADGLRRALAPVHRRYAGHVLARRRRSGQLWRGRFASVPMDEDYLGAALRYVSLNPVRARLVARAKDWRWSSAGAHLRRRENAVMTLAPVLARYPRFADLLKEGPAPDLFKRLRQAESIGRPLGSDAFMTKLERLTRRSLKPQRRGPKPSHEGKTVSSRSSID